MKSIALFLFILCIGCNSSKSLTTSKSHSENTRGNDNYASSYTYWIDLNGEGAFEEVDLDQKPEPVQGVAEWTRSFAMGVKYPPAARKSGLSGTVLLQIDINALGRLGQVIVHEGLSPECDEAALAAFHAATTSFYPAIYQGNPTAVRMHIPCKFRVH